MFRMSDMQAQIESDNQIYERQMVEVFRQQLELERMLEKAKVDLTLRTDFNLIDAFRVFDTQGKGWISATELKEALTIFNIFAQPDDIQFFIKRYDKDEDNRIRYSEFCDAFLPIDSFHASLLAKKAPLHMYHVTLSQEKVFYPETRDLFIVAWKTHLRNEGEAEKIRYQVQSNA